MKKTTISIIVILIAAISYSQTYTPYNKPLKYGTSPTRDSIESKAIADSIRNNTPILSRNDVIYLMQLSINGYVNNRGQFVKSRMAAAITKDDMFNGEECERVMQYVIEIIGGDLQRLMDAVEKRK